MGSCRQSFTTSRSSTSGAPLGTLCAHPELRDASIIAMGQSRGGELVLQLASLYDCFAAVIATSPGHVRWGAMGQAGAAWTFEGSPLAFVQPITVNEFVARAQEVRGRSYVVYREWYWRQLEENPSVEAATICVERVNGSILLICGFAFSK